MTTTEQGSREAWFWRLLFAILGIAVLTFSVVLIFAWEPTTTVVESTIPAGQTGLTESKRTTTTAPISDSLSASVLGFTLLLLLVAAYYNRITKITGPGGIGAELSNDQKDSAAKIVAAKASEAVPEIKELAKKDVAASPAQAEAAASALAVTSATATSTVQDSARQLLTLSRVSPDQCRNLASRLEIPADVIENSVIQQRTTPQLWEALADHVLRSG